MIFIKIVWLYSLVMWREVLVEQDMLTLPKHLMSSQFLCVRVHSASVLVFCVVSCFPNLQFLYIFYPKSYILYVVYINNHLFPDFTFTLYSEIVYVSGLPNCLCYGNLFKKFFISYNNWKCIIMWYIHWIADFFVIGILMISKFCFKTCFLSRSNCFVPEFNEYQYLSHL